MNYQFIQETRTALGAAHDEAVRLGHDYVAPEHIVLGLVRDGMVAEILEKLRLSPERVRRAVEERLPAGSVRLDRSASLPYTSGAKKVLELTMTEARADDGTAITPKHLLLGVIREGRASAVDVLREMGVTVERIRAAEAGVLPPVDREFGVRIDDASERTVYEQIVAQVVEAVATGELRPGERLPTVRGLADQLDIAPGTVARAYRELEQQGIVVTEGARGTRVAQRSAAPVVVEARAETLAGLLRPVAVAAYHLGATAEELRVALAEAMRGIFDKREGAV